MEMNEIQAIKEKRKQEIRERNLKKGLKIGMVVIKNNHSEGCECLDCLTCPEPFFPFPEEHKKFVETIFNAVK